MRINNVPATHLSDSAPIDANEHDFWYQPRQCKTRQLTNIGWVDVGLLAKAKHTRVIDKPSIIPYMLGIMTGLTVGFLAAYCVSEWMQTL